MESALHNLVLENDFDRIALPLAQGDFPRTAFFPMFSWLCQTAWLICIIIGKNMAAIVNKVKRRWRVRVTIPHIRLNIPLKLFLDIVTYFLSDNVTTHSARMFLWIDFWGKCVLSCLGLSTWAKRHAIWLVASQLRSIYVTAVHLNRLTAIYLQLTVEKQSRFTWERCPLLGDYRNFVRFSIKVFILMKLSLVSAPEADGEASQ